MAAICGKNGSVTWANKIINVRSWSADLTCDEHPGTVAGTTGGTSIIPGLWRCRGTIACICDSAVSPELPGGLATSLTLTMDSGNTLSFSAILVGNSISVEIEGEAGFVASFVMSQTTPPTIAGDPTPSPN